MPPRPQRSLPTRERRAIVLGAGSLGTAVAVLLARGGFRTTLQTRTAEQAARLQGHRENKASLAGVAPRPSSNETRPGSDHPATTLSRAGRVRRAGAPFTMAPPLVA